MTHFRYFSRLREHWGLLIIDSSIFVRLSILKHQSQLVLVLFLLVDVEPEADRRVFLTPIVFLPDILIEVVLWGEAFESKVAKAQVRGGVEVPICRVDEEWADGLCGTVAIEADIMRHAGVEQTSDKRLHLSLIFKKQFKLLKKPFLNAIVSFDVTNYWWAPVCRLVVFEGSVALFR